MSAFTLVELMIALTLLLIVAAGVLSSYLYMGRNLTRLVNMQEQEVKCRRAFEYFARDVGAASSFSTTTDTVLAFSLTNSAGATDSVIYTYTAGANATGTLVRRYTVAATSATTTLTMLTNLSAFDFNYFNESSAATTTTGSVKSVQFSFTSEVGTSLSGTRASYSNVSARIVARNKAGLL